MLSNEEIFTQTKGVRDPSEVCKKISTKARLIREKKRIKIDDITAITIDINPQNYINHNTTAAMRPSVSSFFTFGRTKT